MIPGGNRRILAVVLATLIIIGIASLLYFYGRRSSVELPTVPAKNIETPVKAPAVPPPKPEAPAVIQAGGLLVGPEPDQSSLCRNCQGKCYGIQRGDTLSGIALRFYGTIRAVPELAKINKIADPNKIYAESCICLSKIKLPVQIKSAAKQIKTEPKQPEQGKGKALTPCPPCPACPPSAAEALESAPEEKEPLSVMVLGDISQSEEENEERDSPFVFPNITFDPDPYFFEEPD